MKHELLLVLMIIGILLALQVGIHIAQHLDDDTGLVKTLCKRV